jgi:hypothetical protein
MGKRIALHMLTYSHTDLFSVLRQPSDSSITLVTTNKKILLRLSVDNIS